MQGVTGMKIKKIDDENIDLSLNPKHKTKKTKTRTQSLKPKTQNVQD